MAKVRMADAKAAYFQTRLQWAEITKAKLQGSGSQRTMHSYTATVAPEPFPEYDTIHPSHLNNPWPTFGGTKITGALIRGLIMVCSKLHTCSIICLHAFLESVYC